MASHFPRYSQNFSDRSFLVRCSCGWSVTGDCREEAEQLFSAHSASPPKLAVVVERPLEDGQEKIIAEMEKVIGLIRSGEVRDLAIIYDHRGNKKYHTNGFMDDRWRLIGAIEYAKKYAMED